MRRDADRVFYLFAIFMGDSVYLKNILYQITVSHAYKDYIVQCGKVRKHYSTKESFLKDWDVIYFE